MGTQKAKSNHFYCGLCPLEHVPIVNLPTMSMFKTAELIMRKETNAIKNKVKLEVESHNHSYMLTLMLIKEMCDFDYDAGINECIGHMLLRHRVLFDKDVKSKAYIEKQAKLWASSLGYCVQRKTKINNPKGENTLRFEKKHT